MPPHTYKPVKELKTPVLTPQAQIDTIKTVTPQTSTASSGAVSSCGDPKSCIYSHESGNDPTRYNSIGCLGLGQACPASKLLAVCPTMDYACEDQWFTGYMESRYGTWDAAWSFWQANRWW